MARELASKSELHDLEGMWLFRGRCWEGGVWKLGCVSLTMVNGELTEAGRVFQAQYPSVSLSHSSRGGRVSEYRLLYVKEMDSPRHET